jgi:hypothetical protein
VCCSAGHEALVRRRVSAVPHPYAKCRGGSKPKPWGALGQASYRQGCSQHLLRSERLQKLLTPDHPDFAQRAWTCRSPNSPQRWFLRKVLECMSTFKRPT